ncbi:hypothetical protein OIU77_029479 [Salix suchowensis]|uniref:Uncharacterized protein n=1 Tax=Salix suchowensis TaxID=1278906 RepID=A0ABQ9B8R0_9ROSI|nr:hypothetical protein OIU77_029479 [Salix suchowensis]
MKASSYGNWHIAVNTSIGQDSSYSNTRNTSRSSSRYMMYLSSDFPFMLPKEFGEPKNKQIGGNTEGSALSDGGELAKSLNLLDSKQKWGRISVGRDANWCCDSMWMERACSSTYSRRRATHFCGHSHGSSSSPWAV